ncbi:MAG: 1-acyl-sn-glycerol-3-phosphate acyltransferase [Myxococcaceae bacterium]|nr:1-acyl-sn-glycerol-3-phosphate acyltransferase [Myxococcaceae bacterium]
MVSARGTLRLLNLGAATVGWVAAASAHQRLVPPAERDAVFQRYLKRWASSLVQATGGQVQLVPGCTVPAHTKPRLVVANHRSPFDIGVLLGLFGGHALSRADLARWPVLGMAARRAGTIFVDRDSGGSRASAVRVIRTRLAQGVSILLFPEGATFEGDEVRPFHPGAFAALRGLDAEIVPVGLAYDPGVEFVDESFVEHVVRVAARPVTHCVVNIGAARPAEGGAKALASAVHDEVQQLVHGARESWRAAHGR